MTRLSVIFLGAGDGANLTKVIRHLSTHQWADQMELVVAIDQDSQQPALDSLERFAALKVVRAPVRDDIGKAREAAIRAASAPFVVFGEDHCFPVEGWAQGLLEHLERGVAGVGPKILVENPKTSASWCDAILCYGDFLQVPYNDSASHLPWHNSAYRRDLLLAFGDELSFLLRADSLLQTALLDQGHRFVTTPDAAASHCNHSLVLSQSKALYWGNRLYGATRATQKQWPFTRKLFYAAAWPAIVALRGWRAVQRFFSLRRDRPLPRTLLPMLLANSLIAATGEVCGYLFGLGSRTLRLRSYYELTRASHVVPSEVQLLRD